MSWTCDDMGTYSPFSRSVDLSNSWADVTELTLTSSGTQVTYSTGNTETIRNVYPYCVHWKYSSTSADTSTATTVSTGDIAQAFGLGFGLVFFFALMGLGVWVAKGLIRRI